MIQRESKRTISSMAPVRICDIGGWTDTWFAVHGGVLNLAVTPAVHVQLRCAPSSGRPAVTRIHAYDLLLGDGRLQGDPLLQAAVEFLPPPDGLQVDIAVHSDAPAGSSMGTSAATCVALLGALQFLRSGRVDLNNITRAAHQVETERLGQQSGIQDQFAAAYGGISYIEMHRYPHAICHRVPLHPTVHRQLARRLSVIFVGQAHQSSAVHELVIREMEGIGPDAPQLVRLRALARRAREALSAGKLRTFGRIMRTNNEVQSDLHPELIGARHRRIIDIARRQGAWGWKVNGAGGAGGSVTILHGPHEDERRETLRLIADDDASFRVIPMKLNEDGLRVWESRPVAGSSGLHRATI